ncbi:hypothetical protein A2630_00380 [Candidatus Woesebacteria bacterium RIFCSPHIGHO2_01_FULL_44_10]|uniref:LytR/CpsA/Psr regulator C-terminal domain-containing protein n=1 Tax=Candidatus Woesebacteria bacterium RIFCSPLOWO2_01_FULL_44_14 TaxID=1802525 RepID=A0A1F8C1F3_9BACT|nr:MAG: hypothetical protein A2630_00380 [Candidatus Woesebacteria bacterium RIFCSPHIGHO2_01_FULL_44_10]OGM53735.1 MAG: hypothetical protein A3F62_03665 [Candidatus Woesebacteria bacterium RIFCSPHIGHO2_12_FULL_44_11]OGM70082.1 MAG: hypothetical protein A2975_03330 [Candidatus Woesebacteria bacterium RIFCSPLOWO2_01_FULL_44_14]
MPEKDKEEEKESPEKTPVETQDEEVVEESRPKAVVEEVKETEPLQEEQLKPEEVEPKASGNFKVVFITALITAIIVASLAGGIYVYLSGVGKLPEVSGETPKPVPTVTPTPTATPEPELDLSVYKVQVLNGSGTAGAAGAAEELLVNTGFVVEDTRNAKTFDFTDTVIQAKENVPEAVVDEAQTALEDDYTIEIGDELPETSDYDLVITVGSK